MDAFFNHEYAEEVAGLISKMDDESARVFSLMVVHDVLHRHMDDNRQLITKRRDEIIKSLNTQVIKSARPLMATDPSAAAAVQLVETISKDWEVFEIDGVKVRRNVKRDRRGRFSRNNYSMKVKDGKIAVKYKGDASDGWDPRANQFDLASALSGATQRTTSFEEQWNQYKDPRYNPNARTYQRVSEGSKLVTQLGLATGSTSVATAGAVGQFAGSFGPEAEKVVGPAIRRTAYRYRGTEKKLDPQIQEMVSAERSAIRRDQKMVRPKLTNARITQIRNRADEEFKKNPQGRSRAQIRQQFIDEAQRNLPPMRAAFTPDQMTETSRKAAVTYLQTRLPSSDLARLQAQSGKIPPSEGLIIDPKGEIVSQAVGYMEDHYLPFNLRNLSALNGGSYVRTRSSGGLTTEDIYTGLMSGARSVTVVSRSGVFTVDFEDDFRGNRRYGDIARGMVQRYAKTLDAVQSETIERAPLTMAERVQIRAEVEEEMKSFKDTSEGRKLIEQRITDRIKEERRNTDLTPKELQAIEQQALGEAGKEFVPSRWMGERASRERIPNTPEERFRYIRAALIEDARAEKENRMLRLDGQGYETALNALKEQYPYFIANIRTQVYKDPERRVLQSRETDTGYVRPNYLRPKAVKEGYFDSEIEGVVSSEVKGKDGGTTGKYAASTTGHQNRANVKGLREQQAAAEVKTEASGESPEKKANLKMSPLDQRQRARMEAELETQVDEALAKAVHTAIEAMHESQVKDLRDLLGGVGENDPKAEERIREALRTPSNRDKAEAGMRRVISTLEKEKAKGGEKADQAEEILSSFKSHWEEALSIKSDIERIAEGVEMSEDFVTPKAHPGIFKDIPAGKDEAFYRDKAKLLSNEVQGLLERGSDEDLFRTSKASKELQSFYSKVAEGKVPTSEEKRAAQRFLRSDAFMYEEDGPEENALWGVILAEGEAAKSQAKLMAEKHKKRAFEVERLRRIQAEIKRAQPPTDNTPAKRED